jgi:hypothetical protein
MLSHRSPSSKHAAYRHTEYEQTNNGIHTYQLYGKRKKPGPAVPNEPVHTIQTACTYDSDFVVHMMQISLMLN